MNRNVPAAQDVGVAVTIGGDGSVRTPEKEADAETEPETGNGGGARIFEKGLANSTPGNEGTSTGPTKTTTVAVAVGEEGVASSKQTKRLGACSCPPGARTQEAAVQKGTAGEDH